MDITEGWQEPRGAHTAVPLPYAQQLAKERGLGFVDLFEADIEPQMIELVTADLCRRHRVIPVTVSQHRVRLAMVDPGNIIAIDDVAGATGRTVTPLVASAEAMEYALTRYARLDKQIAELSSELSAQAAALDLDRNDDELSETGEDAPIVKFVNLIISQAIQDRASDIHIEPADGTLRVRYRIDGVLREVQNTSSAIAGGVISRLKIMSNIDIAERRLPQDGRMAVKHRGREVDLRVATLPTLWGEKVVMRILDTPAERLRLTDLEMSARNLDVFSASYRKPHGMVLVTGPTGSGKSTTLYMTLHEIVRPEINVITVEDPVEYRMDGVNQMQVNPRAGLTFDSALRSILRSDPDVVLVGEIRDSETAQTSIEASLTGHLVLSTLHTNDAPSAATRLIEMGIEPFLVASALDAVMAQRLARRLCADCVVMRQPSPAVLQSIGFTVPGGIASVGEPQGCSRCAGTGYRGRVAIHEVMQVTPEIAHLIVSGASSQKLRSLAVEQGMVSLREDGWRKVLGGVTSIEEVLRVTV